MKRNALGSLIIIIGVALLLASLNIGHAQKILETWWPLAIVGFGIIQLMDRTQKQDWWPWLLIGVGGFLLTDNLFDLSFDLWSVFWPVVIIAFGASFFRRDHDLRDTESLASSDGDVTAILGGSQIRNTSSDYTGNRVTAVLGGIEMDISKATIKRTATINVTAFMGGVELRVPEHAIVKNRTTSILGGFEDKTRAIESKNAPVLYVTGTIMMGGVEIKR